MDTFDPRVGNTYLVVVCPKNIIVRVPQPLPIWREMLKAMTVVLREHGLRRKDVGWYDGAALNPANYDNVKPEDVEFRRRLEAAFRGDPAPVASFHLYEWAGDGFRLARRAAER